MREMPYRQLVRVLRANDVELKRTTGSHEVWVIGPCATVVPHHRMIAPGTLRSIERHLAPCLGKDWLDNA